MSYQTLVTKSFPKIVAIGKNYLKHVFQMGGKDIPTQPIIFQKPWSSLVYQPKQLKLSHPLRKNEIHHQIELGVVVGKKATMVSKKEAMDYVEGYFLALDLTDRDLQGKAKKSGSPWDLSKGQDNFCPVSSFVQRHKVKDPYGLRLTLNINGKIVQEEMTGGMHYKIDDIIEYVSQFMTLNPGDLILTGTPDGVGPIKPGDSVLGKLTSGQESLATLEFTVT